MFGTHDLPLFVVSGLLLNMTPGQDTMYILGRTIAQGRGAGVSSALGIAAGSLVHTCLAAFGVSAILAASPMAFLAVKYAGAGYLIWLGVRMFMASSAEAPVAETFGREDRWSVFRAGVLTNVLNPKVALFFMAFLPQFVDAGADSRAAALMFLGALFVVNGFLWCLVLVTGASVVAARLQTSSGSARWLGRITGLVFVGLGVRLAVSR
jgi:RhtB (resistance to homoserine/threonine) family protein